MNSANVIALDEVGLAPGQILTDGVREWRPNCQSGQFSIGPANPRGTTLTMEVIAVQPFFGELFGYAAMDWLGVLFVDPDGALSSMLLKTESRSNFLELHRQQRLSGKTLLGHVIQGKMSRRTNKKGNFFAVEFSMADTTAQFAEAIAAFRQQYDFQALLTFPESAPGDQKALAAA